MQLLLELNQELVDHAHDDVVGQRGERNGGVEPVAEFRREQALDFRHLVASNALLGETHRGLGQFRSAGVGGHDDYGIAEIRLAAIVIGQRAVIHHLQQDVVDIRMRLLDFIEQYNRIRMLGDLLC